MNYITLTQCAPDAEEVTIHGYALRLRRDVHSVTLDADAPGAVARIGEFVRETLALGYTLHANKAETITGVNSQRRACDANTDYGHTLEFEDSLTVRVSAKDAAQ